MAANAGFIIIGCWIFFIVYWTVTAFRQKRAAERSSFVSSLPYRVPLVLGGFLLWFQRFPHPLSFALTPHAEPEWILGAAICAFGLATAIWARRTLAGNWSSEVTFKQSHELIRTGPYHFVRHPIYTGLILMCLGTAIAPGQVHSWLGFLLLCVGFWIKLKQEERLMLQHFPDEYPAYQSQVKALVPFII